MPCNGSIVKVNGNVSTMAIVTVKPGIAAAMMPANEPKNIMIKVDGDNTSVAPRMKSFINYRPLGKKTLKTSAKSQLRPKEKINDKTSATAMALRVFGAKVICKTARNAKVAIGYPITGIVNK